MSSKLDVSEFFLNNKHLSLHVETIITCDDATISRIALSKAIIDYLLVTSLLFGINHSHVMVSVAIIVE